MRCTQAVEAGTYVLGALAPADRSIYQRHLATCADCRDEVADLAGLPGLLGRLDEPTAAMIAGFGPEAADTGDTIALRERAPQTILDGALSRVQRERFLGRRRTRRQIIGSGLVAACLALLAGAGMAEMIQTPIDNTVMGPMDSVTVNPDVSAVIGYYADKDGTHIKMSCVYSPDVDHSGSQYELVAVSRTNQATVLKTWMVAGDPYKEVETSSELKPQDIARLELRNAKNETLLVYQVT